MTEASITIEDIQGASPTKVVHISGQLDESNVDSKIQEIYQSVESAAKGLCLIFELANLQYMNSKSIGYITDLYGKITENGGKVAIAQAKPNIIDILQVVGLTQLIQTFDTLEQAKAHVGQVSPAETPAAAPAEAPAEAPATPETPAPAEAPAEPQAPAPAAPVEAPAEPQVPAAPAEAPATPAVDAGIEITPQQQPAAPETPAAPQQPAPAPTAEVPAPAAQPTNEQPPAA